MSIREMVLPDDKFAQDLLRDWDRANQAAADIVNTGGQVEFLDVQVGYKLKESGDIFREEVLKQVAPGVLTIINMLALHIQSQYTTISIKALTSADRMTRYVNVRTDDILYINVMSEVHMPEQNQDDERRAKLRGHQH